MMTELQFGESHQINLCLFNHKLENSTDDKLEIRKKVTKKPGNIMRYF